MANRLVKLGKYGVVSRELPLLSNLSLYENIEIVVDYHRQNRDMLENLLADQKVRLKLDKREPSISSFERFATMFLRAVSFSRRVLLVRPFTILTDADSTWQIDELVEKTSHRVDEVLVFDLEWNRNRYKEGYIEKH